VGKTILIVDDHRQVGDAVAEMLRVMGHQAHFFSSPAMSIDWLESNQPDLAIFDLSMPGTDGVELLLTVRDLGHNFPIIILTGYPESSLAKEALEFGAHRVVTKPISMDELLGLVENL
jgi:DNA-binding response OmpR family regulator